MMDMSAQILLTLGGILLLGMATDMLGQRTFLPRVTLLLVFGVIIGEQMLNLIPAVISERFELIANMALLMVGFLLGGKLTRDSLRHSSRMLICVSVGAVIVTALVVAIGLALVGVPVEVALLAGCIAAATDPAATMDTVLESGRTGPFPDLLLKIVALDDAWGLVIFSLGMAVAVTLDGGGGAVSPLLLAGRDIGGAVLLGLAIGLPAAYLTGRIRPGQPMLTEALGLVFLCGGLALWLEVSFLIASMVMGAAVANLAKHHEYPFHAIEGIEWPFLALFFVLAGASLDFSLIGAIGLIGTVYVICRVLGKILGAEFGGRCGGAGAAWRRWTGVAMLPQAGAAMGMALVATSRFPEHRQLLLTLVISTTVLFEIIGPVFTRLALRRADVT